MNSFIDKIFSVQIGAIPTNLTCNLRCSFCDSAADVNPPELEPAGILETIASLRKSSSEIVFTGGEPTINKNILKYIKAAGALGFKSIRIETNALMFSYPGAAEKFKAAGLTGATATMPAGDEIAYEKITRAPGSWSLAVKGIAALCDSGIPVSISIPLLAETTGNIEAHIKMIIEHFPSVSGAHLFLVEPPGGAPVSAEKISSALRKVAAVAKSKLSVRLRPLAAPPPCLLDSPEDFYELFEFPPLPEGRDFPNHKRLPLCESCFLAAYCPGVHSGVSLPLRNPSRPAPAFARLVLKQWPQRDPVAQANTGAASQFVLSPLVPDRDGNFIEEALLRINYSCNQRCLFCWLEPEFQNPSHETVLENIARLSDYDVGSVCVTGGEPTLNSHLDEYIRLLKTKNIRKVCLQTNAVKLDKERAASVVNAGLDFAFVSLHSHDAALSDMLTGMEGSFEKTVEGVRNLRALGIPVLISHVMNAFNYETLPDFVRFAKERLEGASLVFLNAAPIYGAMMHRGLIVKFSDLRKPLADALDLCYELRIPFSGLASMCGIPLCVLDGDPKYFPDMRPVKNMQDDSDMIKTGECATCSLSECCFGLRKNYADFYGTGEIRAIKREFRKPGEVDVWNSDYMKEYYTRVFGGE